MAIDKAFREAKITIAFPQRDTHLNTLEPLEIRIVPTDAPHGGPAEAPRDSKQ
jgi:small-conductance mechanosensitive channel